MRFSRWGLILFLAAWPTAVFAGGKCGCMPQHGENGGVAISYDCDSGAPAACQRGTSGGGGSAAPGFQYNSHATFGQNAGNAAAIGTMNGIQQGAQGLIQQGIRNMFSRPHPAQPRGPSPEQIQQQQQYQQQLYEAQQAEAARQAAEAAQRAAAEQQRLNAGKQELNDGWMPADGAAQKSAVGASKDFDWQVGKPDAVKPKPKRVVYVHGGAHRVRTEDGTDGSLAPSGDASSAGTGAASKGDTGFDWGAGPASGDKAAASAKSGGSGGGTVDSPDAFGMGNSKVRLGKDGNPQDSLGGETQRAKKNLKIRHPQVAQENGGTVVESTEKPATIDHGAPHDKPTTAPPQPPAQYEGNVEAQKGPVSLPHLLWNANAPNGGVQGMLKCATLECGATNNSSAYCPQGYPYLSPADDCNCFRSKASITGNRYAACQYTQ